MHGHITVLFMVFHKQTHYCHWYKIVATTMYLNCINLYEIVVLWILLSLLMYMKHTIHNHPLLVHIKKGLIIECEA